MIMVVAMAVVRGRHRNWLPVLMGVVVRLDSAFVGMVMPATVVVIVSRDAVFVGMVVATPLTVLMFMMMVMPVVCAMRVVRSRCHRLEPQRNRPDHYQAQ